MDTTMNLPRTVLWLGALLLSSAALARDGARPIDERRPLRPDARVEVSNVAGSIVVEAWDRNELHLTGRLDDAVEALAITGDAAALRIEVKLPRRSHNAGDTDLRLKVPAGTRLRAEGVSADVRVSGLKGDVRAASVSGDVRLDVPSRRVEAQSVSGDVTVRAPAASARVETVSGDVTLVAHGDVRSESVSGQIRVEAREVRELDVESVSGDLLLDLELAKDADVSAETLSGQVEVRLSALPDGEIELETFSGDLHSAFAPGIDDDAKQYRHQGPGRGRLSLHSHSGDVELKKK